MSLIATCSQRTARLTPACSDAHDAGISFDVVFSVCKHHFQFGVVRELTHSPMTV